MTSSACATVLPELASVGAYTMVKPLAQGGMADVYLAQSADRHVAVKVLNNQRSLDADACKMFIDEARVVAMLDHPNVASVLDVDVRDGLHYLAMEYVHGKDLRELLLGAAYKGAMVPYEVSLAIVAQAAAGLDHAHRRCDGNGHPLLLVHRDVSLSNIMVGFDGSVKVVDFGIARSTLSSVHTSPGIVRGKASYMSPEQCLGEKVDHRTDVFALGIVLYELTTGARCFAGKSDFERMLAVVRGDFISPSDLIANYPIELEQVVRCALALDPALRYPSCAAMIEALNRVMMGRGWLGGATAIQSLMNSLFGDVREPWAEEESTVVENAPLAFLPPAPPTAKITRSKRYARGTISDVYRPVQWADDDDDARTRGNRAIRRSSPMLAA